MAIVLPQRKSSLSQMIKERHNSRETNLKVLEKLKPIVCNEHSVFDSQVQHGDLKEKCDLKMDSFSNLIL